MTTKSKGSSVRQGLISLAVKLGIPFQNIETAFIRLISLILVAIEGSEPNSIETDQ